MTRGDFILGVASSLVATILFELTRKIYPLLKEIAYPFLIITAVITSLIILSFRKFNFRELPIRFLTPSIALVIAFFALVNLPQYTVLAPSKDLENTLATNTQKGGATAIVSYEDSRVPVTLVPTPCMKKNEPVANPDNDPVLEVINKLPTAPCFLVDNSP